MKPLTKRPLDSERVVISTRLEPSGGWMAVISHLSFYIWGIEVRVRLNGIVTYKTRVITDQRRR